MPSGVAPSLSAGIPKGDHESREGLLIPAYVPDIVAQAMSSKWSKGSSGPAGDEIANLVASPIPFDTTQITHPENRSNPQPGDPAGSLAKGGHAPTIAFAIQGAAGRENPASGPDGVGVRSDGAAYTLEARSEVQAVAFHHQMGEKAGGVGASEETSITLGTKVGGGAVAFDHLAGGKTRLAIGDEVAGALRVSGNATGHQSVAYDMRNGTGADVAHTLQAAGIGDERGGNPNAIPHTLSGWRVRRLTPTECERLQGFPEISKKVTVLVCAGENIETASFADPGSPAQNPDQLAPVAAHVLIDFVRMVVELRNPEKSLWSASIAGPSNSSPLPMEVGDFARAAAHLTHAVVTGTPHGAEALQPSTNGSFHRLSGSGFVATSGREIAELANDAGKFTNALARCMKSTTLPFGPSSPNSEPTVRTLSSCVAAAISSFIPEQIRGQNSFIVEIETVEGYTQILHRGKPAADGPRYKALGNSMACNVMRVLGQRLEIIDKL